MLEYFFQIFPILVSLLLDFSLLRLKTKSGLVWLFTAWLALSISLFFYLTGGWFISSYYLRYVVLGAGVLSVFISLIRLPGCIWTPVALRSTDKAEVLGNLVPALFFSYLAVTAWLGGTTPENGINLQFPLKGRDYLFAQAGASWLTNHHSNAGSQKYAQDIIQLNSWGRSASGFNPTALEEYVIYGQPVYSPCDGIVSVVLDGFEDLPPGGTPSDEEDPAGNHIYIQCKAQDAHVLLAHMKQGTIIPSAGSRIRTGEMVGQVGNSGNTTEPHLHIHARRGGNLDDVIAGTGIPILYDEVFFCRNDLLSN